MADGRWWSEDGGRLPRPRAPALERIDRMNRTVEKHPANPVYPVRIKSPCRINPAPGESGSTAALPHPLRLGRGEGRGEVSRPFLSWQDRKSTRLNSSHLGISY